MQLAEDDISFEDYAKDKANVFWKTIKSIGAFLYKYSIGAFINFVYWISTQISSYFIQNPSKVSFQDKLKAEQANKNQITKDEFIKYMEEKIKSYDEKVCILLTNDEKIFESDFGIPKHCMKYEKTDNNIGEYCVVHIAVSPLIQCIDGCILPPIYNPETDSQVFTYNCSLNKSNKCLSFDDKEGKHVVGYKNNLWYQCTMQHNNPSIITDASIFKDRTKEMEEYIISNRALQQAF